MEADSAMPWVDNYGIDLPSLPSVVYFPVLVWLRLSVGFDIRERERWGNLIRGGRSH